MGSEAGGAERRRLELLASVSEPDEHVVDGELRALAVDVLAIAALAGAAVLFVANCLGRV